MTQQRRPAPAQAAPRAKKKTHRAQGRPQPAPISAALSPEVRAEIARRAAEHWGRGAPAVIHRDLARYYAVLRDSLRRVVLTRGEAALICDALNGTIVDHHTYLLLWASIEDAVRLDAADRKWEVDGPALVAKLQVLSPGEMLAVADAVERFWRIAPGQSRPIEETLREVGLLPAPV